MAEDGRQVVRAVRNLDSHGLIDGIRVATLEEVAAETIAEVPHEGRLRNLGRRTSVALGRVSTSAADGAPGWGPPEQRPRALDG